jgi:alpha-L-rhamnosidase
MKKYVWSETRAEGGRPFVGALPKPPSATGSYQNQPAGGRGFGGGGRGPQAPPPEFYADAAVVAFRAPGEACPGGVQTRPLKWLYTRYQGAPAQAQTKLRALATNVLSKL